MDGFGLFIYGYMLPLLVTLAWAAWTVRREKKAGRRLVLRVARDWWPMLIPGIGLWGACALLMLAAEAGSFWLERHWEPWRTASEQPRRVWRRMLKTLEDR